MKKYVGLSLFIDMSIAQKSISKYFPYGNIDLFEMRDKVCKNGAALIIRSRHEINHIIGELYKVDERIQLSYSIIKTIELLLFLSLVESKDIHKLPSFSEPVYEATRECYKSLMENLIRMSEILLSTAGFLVLKMKLENIRRYYR